MAFLDAGAHLKHFGLPPTAHREEVVRALAAGRGPQTPQDLLEALAGRMNRVTLYRILDLLVQHGVATRHNAGERAFRYCLAGGGPHGGLQAGKLGHAHFHCTSCGRTTCLDVPALSLDLARACAGLPMRVDMAECSLSGVCEGCLTA